MLMADWSLLDARIGYGTTKSEEPFSALIFRRPSFGGLDTPSRPMRPPLVLPGSIPWGLAKQESRWGVEAPEGGVDGEMTSELLRFPVLDASETPGGREDLMTMLYSRKLGNRMHRVAYI